MSREKEIRAKMKYSAWELIEEPNTVDTLGRPVYHARCPKCGFIWTNLHAVVNYFKHCPGCGKNMEEG